MKRLRALFLMTTIIALAVVYSGTLYAGENCDTLAVKYVYQFEKKLIVRGSLNRAYFEQPFGFSNLRDTFCSIYIQLNRDNTVEKWNETELAELGPDRPGFRRKGSVTEGTWIIYKDTVNVRLINGSECYLVRNDQLIQLFKKDNGTFVEANVYKKWNGGYRDVFSRKILNR